METGIYEIVNLKNSKSYVGSAVNFSKRWNSHRHHLARGTHHSRHLQASWNRHGAENFQFRKVLVCAPEHLLLYEQIVLDQKNPAYNVARVAGNTLGTKRTPESRAKISARAKGRSWSEESKAKLSATMSGRRISEAARKKMIGNKRAAGTVHSEDRKKQASESSKAMWQNPEKRAFILQNRGVEWRENIANSLRGRKATPEARANQAAAQKGKKRGPYKPMSAETKASFIEKQRIARVKREAKDV